jgi:hypothetical protein
MLGQVIAEAPAGGTYDGGGACSHAVVSYRIIGNTTGFVLRRWAP